MLIARLLAVFALAAWVFGANSQEGLTRCGWETAEAARAAGVLGGGPPVAMTPGSNGNFYPTSDPEAVELKGELQPFGRLDYVWSDAVATLDASKVMTEKDAEKWVGKVIIVEGLVVRSRESRGSTFLNFREKEFKKAFTVYSKAGGCDFAAPLAELCLGKRIAILGELVMYKGTPEIVLDQPSQLRILN